MTGISTIVARHSERIRALESDIAEIKESQTFHTRLLLLTALSGVGTLLTMFLKH